jgi:hypothetical protein
MIQKALDRRGGNLRMRISMRVIGLVIKNVLIVPDLDTGLHAFDQGKTANDRIFVLPAPEQNALEPLKW